MELTFQTGEVKAYDMAVLFQKYPQLEALKDRKLFLQGKLMGAYGIIWNDNLDIEAETIYEDGITVRREPVSINQSVGYAIAEARSNSGLSQSALAAKTGIDQSDISKIERGVSNPSISTLGRLVDAMGKSIKISIY